MTRSNCRSAIRSIAAPLLALISAHLMAGCGLFVVGAVVGAGAYTYINGELKRSYQAGYEATVQAAVDALADMQIEAKSIQKHGLTTTIDGRSKGKPVTVGIARVDVNISEVGVRSGYVGVWDRKFSTEIHEKIARRLRS